MDNKGYMKQILSSIPHHHDQSTQCAALLLLLFLFLLHLCLYCFNHHPRHHPPPAALPPPHFPPLILFLLLLLSLLISVHFSHWMLLPTPPSNVRPKDAHLLRLCKWCSISLESGTLRHFLIK